MSSIHDGTNPSYKVKILNNGSIVTDVAQYSFRQTFTGTGQVEYFGLAIPGSTTATSAWLIRKQLYNESDQQTSLVYASGEAKFNKLWTKRASYAYL